MNYSTDNTRIIDRKKVPAPYELVNKYPINDEISKLVFGTRMKLARFFMIKMIEFLLLLGHVRFMTHKVLLNMQKSYPLKMKILVKIS